MKIFDQYLELQREIYDYFGYIEEWRVYPLDDLRDMWWSVEDSTLWFTTTKEIMENLIKAGYEYEELNTNDQDHVFSHIVLDDPLEKEDFTMIKVDTQTDGNDFLSILDNSKKVG